MGVSTDGILCYGIDLGAEEEIELPWSKDSRFEGDEMEWWRHVTGFVPSFYPFTEKGDYHPEITDSKDPRIARYFEEVRAWDETHPLPVQVVRHCSDDYVMYILAVPGTECKAWRGYPVVVDFAALSALATPEADANLLSFCNTYGIPHDGGPRWLLASWWG